MDHIIKTYGVLLPDADFTVIHSGICTLNESVEHIACDSRELDFNIYAPLITYPDECSSGAILLLLK